MVTYRQVRLLSAADAAYIAGVIDGEGTVTLSRRHGKDRRQLVVSIANTEVRLLEYVRSRVAAGKITHKATIALHHTPSYTYTICNRQALALLRQVQPFLRTHKRERAALVLSRYISVTPRNGKYDAESEELRAKFEAAFFAMSARAVSSSEFGEVPASE